MSDYSYKQDGELYFIYDGNSMVKINEIDCGEKMPEVWRKTI